MSEPIILAQHINKTYYAAEHEVRALRDVTLEISEGEMIAVMGPSGCGKTTLLNCLSGLDEVDSGKVFIDGNALHQMSDRARTSYRARHMGFVFQFFGLLPVLTALENVELPLLVDGLSPGRARQRALEVIEQVDMLAWAHHQPKELSGGQCQRFQLARALVNHPAIVWADEPTGSLDSRAAGAILDLIQQLNQERNLTVVIATHDLQVSTRCSRVIQMHDGYLDDGASKETEYPVPAIPPAGLE